MATDLVRWNRHFQEDGEDEKEEWDRPPTAPAPGPLHDASTQSSARQADRDAAQAQRRGDGTFAVMRESDAADLRQTRWDWGDLRTWVWIAGMCLGFLLFCLFVYVMPYSRHNQTDLPASSPTIRVY